MKKIAQIALLLFALGAIGFWAWEKLSPAFTTSTPEQAIESPADITAPKKLPQSQQAVLVTYFTTDVRCESCIQIETLTRQTLDENFTQELAAGTLRFQTLNLDKKANKHFTKDYELAFKTVVVSTESQGKVTHWQKLDDVWTLLNDPAAFKAYVANPIRALLSPES